LFDALKRRFGEEHIFRDLEDLPPGVVFPDAINQALTDCDVMLVMIGPRWISAAGRNGRRIDEADDFVRKEVSKALSRKDVCVIPVLVGGAKMPEVQELPEDLHSLHWRSASELSDTRWDYDVERLGDAVAKQWGISVSDTSRTAKGAGNRIGIWVACIAVAVLLAGSLFYYLRQRPDHTVSATQPPPSATQQPASNLANLEFSIKYDKNDDRPNLAFLQKEPKFRQAHNIGPEADGHYQLPVDWPSRTDEHFEASAERPVPEGNQQDHPVVKPTQLCFTSNPKPPTNNPPFGVVLECSEGKKCSLGANDYGWATECPTQKAESPAFALIPALLAQGPGGSETGPGWRVPSLATLQQMKDTKRAGYTEFSIKASSLAGLEAADRFRYQISANGATLYIDGWPPEDMLKQFNALQGLDFSFGMENLSFSGADKGCENIDVVLEFRKGSQPIKTIRLNRQYAALRDAVTEVQSVDGHSFTWSGTYVKPRNEDRAEVFVTSTDVAGAVQTKSRIGAASLSYQGMPVIGVIRPPLDAKNYGIVVGLVQPSGQVKFTFDPTFARQFKDWVLQQDRKVFQYPLNHPPFVYESKPGPAGTGALQWCSKAAVRG
jgi:hypothetical protein